MIKLGMLIADRYEILEKIGTGGMADVYKAKDIKLNRYVAVKVLKQEFAENKNFVSKFRVEAQAAAGLMHPNIVNVYDVGEEDGIHYIVMELVEGITLKKYIEKKSRLSTKEAISIAIQVAMGMEAAHNNHIIHRDIKPQNIIISKEGKVKVTDFGIAKAASSNTITSNVMGSVHYTSPEQARGGFSDEKSDIYSLGITLFEMLTGRVPFNGDTTVAIAIKQIQDPMPSPREFVPEVPVSVERIVLKCTQKSPDRRYQNMGDMIRDLKRSLITPDESFVEIDNGEAGQTRIVTDIRNRNTTTSTGRANTGEVPVQRETVRQDTLAGREVYATPEEAGEIVRRRPAGAQNGAVKKNEGRSRNTGASKNQPSGKAHENKKKRKKSGQKPVRKATVKKEEQEKQTYTEYTNTGVNRQNVRNTDYTQDISFDTKEEYDYNPATEKVTTILTIIAAVAIGCILLYYAGQAVGIFSAVGTKNQDSQTESAQRSVMPEFAGLNIDEVKKALQDVNLGSKTQYIESTEYDKNVVISAALEDGTAVLAGDQIIKNTTIVLTVSAGANGINVPQTVGLSEAEGTAQLTKEGFTVTKSDAYSTEYAKGTIISQSPEGDSIAALGSEVTIVISKGNEDVEVRMPDVLGKSKDAAVSMLEESGLVVGNVEDSYSTEYPEGQICYQSYSSGTSVGQGTIVDLKVSIGSETATYSCNLSIQAPSDYIGGNAEVILTTADGSQQLWYSQNVTSFPVSINLSGFTSSSAYGIVTISYLKSVEEIVTDSDGNQTTQVNQALAQTQQNVTFNKD